MFNDVFEGRRKGVGSREWKRCRMALSSLIVDIIDIMDIMDRVDIMDIMDRRRREKMIRGEGKGKD